MKFPEFAVHWAQEIGAEADSLERLSGGINNNVFACRSDNRRWVIKGYPDFDSHRPDRMQAEIEFLEYASRVAEGFTPSLIEVDRQRRCTVMEHISGDTYSEGAIPGEEDIRHAFTFFNRLNSEIGLAKKMVHLDASEGFLSLKGHMENVIGRIALMDTEHLPHKYKSRSSRILNKLHSDSEKIALSLDRKVRSGRIEDAIRADERCISPSDFGFHNAIRTFGGVVFIDFEFAGWDDPAKLCVDFTLQQRNPVILNPLDVASVLFPDRKIIMTERIHAMKDILLLKWVCIILSIFNPERLFNMMSRDSNEDCSCDLIVSRQLARYLRYIEMHSREQ